MKKNQLYSFASRNSSVSAPGLKRIFSILILGLLSGASLKSKAQTPVFTPAMAITCLNACVSPGSEQVENVIDGNINTKFLDANELNTGFVVNTATTPSTVTRIDLTTANDAEERDPIDYTLEGSNNGTTWTSIATSSIPCITTRFFTRSFTFTNTIAYSWYRVSFSSVCNSGLSSAMQIAEVQVFANSVLPIKLISFTSQLKNDNALIQWKLAQPEDGGVYELQRSIDGKNFVSVNLQTGNASTTQFSYTDISLSNGQTYYRLKMTDNEGKITYSNIALIRKGGREINIIVYPNPVKKGNNIQISVNNSILESWKLINMAGETLVQKNNIKITGSTMLQLPETITTGIYYLQLQTDKGIKNEKIVVQ